MTTGISLGAIDAIAFDLDGTLVDSAPDITHALNSALAEVAIDSFQLEAVRGWVGDGPDALILRALGARGFTAPGTELRRRLRDGFDRATLAAPFSRGHVYEGIAPLLSTLSSQRPLVCITNKPTALARAVLGAAQLLPHLCDVLGGDAPEHRKARAVDAADRRGAPRHRDGAVADGRRRHHRHRSRARRRLPDGAGGLGLRTWNTRCFCRRMACQHATASASRTDNDRQRRLLC